MRIDYSEPKKSYVTEQAKLRPRKEPIGFITIIAIATGVITFIGGFGTGWFFSQRAAKKSFQAATEQTSLENSPKPPPLQPQPQSVATVSHLDPALPPTPQVLSASEPPLSFYKTLPNGQKGSVLGSGINTKEDKAKQPLQAAIPFNLTKQPDSAKVVAEKTLATEKPMIKSQDGGAFTVQVGSYSLKSEAENLKAKLVGKGYNVSVVESNQGDKGTWFRVRVGKKLEQDAAKELAAKLGKGSIVTSDRD